MTPEQRNTIDAAFRTVAETVEAAGHVALTAGWRIELPSGRVFKFQGIRSYAKNGSVAAASEASRQGEGK